MQKFLAFLEKYSVLALMSTSLLLHTTDCHAQAISLNEPESEVVAAGVQAGVIHLPSLPVNIEAFLRVNQEMLYSDLFGENVLIEEVYDVVVDTPDLAGLEFSTFSSTAITHDNRAYSVECAVASRIEINAENGYEAEWEDAAETHDLNFWLVYGRLGDYLSGNTAYFYGLVAQSSQYNDGQGFLIPIMQVEDITEEEFFLIWDAVESSNYRALPFEICTDGNGNPIPHDPEYDLCIDAALDDYDTNMNNRIRGLKIRGVLGIVIVGVAGVSCIAFPPTCPIAIGVGISAATAVAYDGADAYTDYHNYADLLQNQLRDCCRDLQLRSQP